MEPTTCRHIPRGDPRCFPSRLSSLSIEDVVYFCGTYPRRCPHFVALEREGGHAGAPAEDRG